ncbi:MAG TPA: EAL domain-containing protein [Solirubrobacteraceae bacterium]|nr:EAL domain-containing protein [Solirubrobacteraceae bacterium]
MPTEVLLVEASRGDARRLMRMLAQGESECYTVTVAHSFAEACRRMAADRYDVVLLNPSLPDANELEALTLAESSSVDVPVVVLSGRDDEGAALDAIGAGAQDWLEKGAIDRERLTRAIRYAITRTHASQHRAGGLYYDHRTGLPTRVSLARELPSALARAARERRVLAVLCIAVEETPGLAGGELLLRSMADRLSGCLRDGDALGYIGGRHFAVVAEAQQPADGGPIARRLLEVFKRPFVVHGSPIRASASVGVAISGSDGDRAAEPPLGRDRGDRAEMLLTSAAAAALHAAGRGGGSFAFADQELDAEAMRRHDLETGLGPALESDQLTLHYQPLLSAHGTGVSALEALVRWEHPERGVIPPLEFIPIAERSGLIVQLGEWVLERACRQLTRWDAAGLPPVRVAVNMSARQFSSPGLVTSVAGVLAHSGLAPGRLDLELTESVFADLDTSVEVLQRVRQLGVRVSLDDFGTGYSSLSYLARMPIDAVKIDRAFVTRALEDPHAAAVVASVIAIARQLGIETVGEGVETPQQARYMTEQGCDLLQGYLYSRPLAPAAAQTWLAERAGDAIRWDRRRAGGAYG